MLLQQTRELHHIQYTLLRPLDFSGIRPHAAQAASQAAKGRILTGQQLVSISQTLNTARNIRRHIDGITTENPNLLDALPRLVSSFRTWPEVQSEIRRCIDEFGEVQETADGALRDLRGQMRATDSEIRKQLNAIMTRYSDAIQDRVITVRYDRFVIPVKMGRKGSFKSGVVHDASASGNTAYIEPASVRRMNDRRRQLAAMEKARVRAILKRLSEKVVAPIVQDVFNLEKVIGVLDAGVGRASFSKMLDCVDVVFDNDRPLRLRGVRHPLLSCKAMADTRKEEGLEECDWKTRVVASDYILPKDVRCVCITGPNTGGKTISLKALGISVLMAKAGMFVPASAEWNSAARIPYFDKVLADIGDDQSLVQSLSTFSGHVRRIKSILASSTGKSLVLLDEIGSGTVSLGDV